PAVTGVGQSFRARLDIPDAHTRVAVELPEGDCLAVRGQGERDRRSPLWAEFDPAQLLPGLYVADTQSLAMGVHQEPLTIGREAQFSEASIALLHGRHLADLLAGSHVPEAE